MIIWTLVTEKIATLQEIETHWSLDDLFRAHDTLEIKAAFIEEQRKSMLAKNQKTKNR